MQFQKIYLLVTSHRFKECSEFRISFSVLITGLRIYVGMDEMYEIFQLAKYRFLGIDEVYEIRDG